MKPGTKTLVVVLVVALFGYAIYKRASAPPDQWEGSLLGDQALAERHCNDDRQCEDDLRVALAGCVVVYREDRDAAYSCQYQHMAKLGVRPPVKRQDGRWVSGNQDEIDTFLEHALSCQKNLTADPSNTGERVGVDGLVTCLNSYPKWNR